MAPSGADPGAQSLAMNTIGPPAGSTAERWLRKKCQEYFGRRKMSMHPDDSMSGA